MNTGVRTRWCFLGCMLVTAWITTGMTVAKAGKPEQPTIPAQPGEAVIARVASHQTWRIWGDGQHNGFPGIARFGDFFYVTFRRARQHNEENDSTIVVIRSQTDDLKKWEKVAEFRRDYDSRDPLLVALNNSLQVVWHSKEDWFSQSTDGTTWSEPKMLDVEFPEPPPGSKARFSSKRRWLFRIRKGPDGAYYSLARCGILEKDSPGPFGLILYRSTDGVHFKALHTFGEGASRAISGGWGHEADLAWRADGTMVAAIREGQGFIAWAAPPYRAWSAYKTGVFNFGGPALHTTPEGGMLLAARDEAENQAGPQKLMVWSVTPAGLANPVQIPCEYDGAYSSFADAPDGGVLLCYYSSHEPIEKPGASTTPSNIYLAHLKIEHEQTK